MGVGKLLLQRSVLYNIIKKVGNNNTSKLNHKRRKRQSALCGLSYHVPAHALLSLTCLRAPLLRLSLHARLLRRVHLIQHHLPPCGHGVVRQRLEVVVQRHRVY